jgi:hypothetical protein
MAMLGFGSTIKCLQNVKWTLYFQVLEIRIFFLPPCIPTILFHCGVVPTGNQMCSQTLQDLLYTTLILTSSLEA